MSRSRYMTVCCRQDLADLPPGGCGCPRRRDVEPLQAPQTMARVLEIQRRRGQMPVAPGVTDPTPPQRRRALTAHSGDVEPLQVPQTMARVLEIQRRRGQMPVAPGVTDPTPPQRRRALTAHSGDVEPLQAPQTMARVLEIQRRRGLMA